MSVSQKIYQNEGNRLVTDCVTFEDRAILDLGCGAGDNARVLAAEGRFIDGVTLSAEEASLASKTMRQVEVHDLEAGLPKSLHGPYDVVIASHVLEHICYPEALLKDVRDALSPNGRLIVVLPNLLMFKYRLRLLMGFFVYETGGIMDNTHFRWYTFDSAAKMLQMSGFRVCKAFAEGHLPLGGLRRLLPSSWARMLDQKACHLFPGLFGAQLVYVSMVEES